MTKQRLFEEWPLAAFTLVIQVACGIAIATTQSSAASAARALGLAMFPIICAGLLISLLHLGRPLSAWRAMTNLKSRLSWEVLLTALFAASAFVCSLTWGIGATTIRLYAGVTASASGIAAVLASAAIYKLPTRPIWNSGWVMASSIGSTMTFTGLALWMCSEEMGLGRAAIFAGSALLLLSALWMWRRSAKTLEDAKTFRSWFIAYLLLAIPVPLLFIFRASSAHTGVVLASCSLVLGIFAGRLLMFALAELEPRF